MGASTAPSITEVAGVSFEPATLSFQAETEGFRCGQSVLVEFDAEFFIATIQCQNPDGSFHVIYDVDDTYEDVEVERIKERSLAEADAAATTEDSSASGNVSKKAKARARKQKRDVAKTSAPSSTASVLLAQAMPTKVETSSVRAGVSQNVWSESKYADGSKTWATRVVPYNC